MPPRQSLKSFLASARTALAAPRRNAPLTFVVGNESADLDSLCSAIVCAYLRSHAGPHDLHIPFANLPRADLPLRTEMTAVLSHVGLTPDELPTLSDLPVPSPVAPTCTSSASASASAESALGDARWFLVDHNALTGGLKPFQANVVGVIDHHVDERVTGAVDPRIIEPCGSCSSLIVAEHASIWDALSPTSPTSSNSPASSSSFEDDQLATLALAPILMDTNNLTDASKVTSQDISALAYLRNKLHSEFLQTSFFETLSAVKEDISALSFRDILRKDYKEWQDDKNGLTVGVSAVVQNFDYLLSRETVEGEFLAAVGHWAKERGVDLVSVMTVSSKGNPGDEFQRHLLVWGVTQGGRRAEERFETGGIGASLGLEAWRAGRLDGEGRRVWRQMDLAASRKQVAPMLRAALREG